MVVCLASPLPLSGLFQQMTTLYFSYFSQETGFDILCKLSLLDLTQDLTFHANCLQWMETICTKCQVLFSWSSKKIILKCRLLKFLPRVLSNNCFFFLLLFLIRPLHNGVMSYFQQ